MLDFVIGDVPGIQVGAEFASFSDLRAAGLHAQTQKGIWGRQADGAASIVVSGGYRDDLDHGDLIIYTGEGGQDDNNKHIADQKLTDGNLSLAVSCDRGLPVRVIRGYKGDPVHSPEQGYRYDGLYDVTSYWTENGVDGYKIWRYRLERSAVRPTHEEGDTRRVVTVTNRILRDPLLGARVKRAHQHACQICSEMVRTKAGAYAEAAHIQPLGTPHNGPDTQENILCLCPNCHVRFDGLAIYVDESGQVRDSDTDVLIGPLRKVRNHRPSEMMLAYQRSLCGR